MIQDLLPHALGALPQVLVALGVLAVGVAVSFLARGAARWATTATGLDAFAERVGAARMLYAVGIKRSVSTVVGTLVLWGGLLLTASVLAESLGLPGVAEGIAYVAGFLPRLLSSGLVLLVGLFVADLLRALVHRVARRRADLDAPGFPAQLVYYATVVVTVSIAADEVGLETGLVDALIQIAVGAAFFGSALAFALGGRGAMQNVIARHYAARMFRAGDRVVVGEVMGEIDRFGAVVVWVRTEDGLVSLPCSDLVDRPVLLRIDRPVAEGAGHQSSATGDTRGDPDEESSRGRS